MNPLEYVIARQAKVLLAEKKRVLTDEECEFLRKIVPLLRRLAKEEQKSISRSGA